MKSKLPLLILPVTLIISLASLTAADEYPFVKTNGGYWLDTASTGRVVKELLDRKECLTLIEQQRVVITNLSNAVIWQSEQLAVSTEQRKDAKKQARRDRVRSFFRGAGAGCGVASAGFLALILAFAL